jgi:hypothetical protein
MAFGNRRRFGLAMFLSLVPETTFSNALRPARRVAVRFVSSHSRRWPPRAVGGAPSRDA